MERRIDTRLRATPQHVPLADWFRTADDFSRYCFLLGGQMKSLGRDHPLRKLFVDKSVSAVDVIVRNFLSLAWRSRPASLPDVTSLRARSSTCGVATRTGVGIGGGRCVADGSRSIRPRPLVSGATAHAPEVPTDGSEVLTDAPEVPTES